MFSIVLYKLRKRIKKREKYVTIKVHFMTQGIDSIYGSVTSSPLLACDTCFVATEEIMSGKCLLMSFPQKWSIQSHLSSGYKIWCHSMSC